MKVNELRIGNLLIDDLTGAELKVIEITEKGFVTYVIDRSKFPLPDGWKANPIPLTEDWLLKFGFEHLPWGWVHGTLKDKAVLIRGLLTKNKFWIELGNGLIIDLPYVHSLQNFFALTGKELSIVEPKSS